MEQPILYFSMFKAIGIKTKKNLDNDLVIIET